MKAALIDLLASWSGGTGQPGPAGREIAAVGKPPHERSAEGFRTIWKVRGLLLMQIAGFLALVSIHFGLPIGSYRHQAAGTIEAAIVAVLATALLLTWMPTPWSRRAATVAQSFGTLGVLAGLITVALGIRPRTILDLGLNVVLLLALIAGLTIVRRE